MKYTFQGVDINYLGKENAKITYEVEAVTIQEFLEHIGIFMRGCGFIFSGDIEVVDNTVSLADDKEVEASREADEPVKRKPRNRLSRLLSSK